MRERGRNTLFPSIFNQPGKDLGRTERVYWVRTIMRKEMLLLVAVLWSGEVCEAALCPNENVEDAKNAVIVNYCLPCGAVKEWRIEQ